MAYRKFANRAAKKIQRRFRKRYVQRKGKLRYGKIARDVARIKGMLNSETKWIETAVTNVLPTNQAPTIYPLTTPDTQGVQGVGQRVGSKVRFNHLSAKFRIGKDDFGFLRSNLTLCCHFMWLKNGQFASDFESDPSYVLNPDVDGNYGPLSYFNAQSYNSWISVHKFQVTMADLVQPSVSAYGLQTDQDSNNTNTNLGRQPNTQYKYVTINKKINVHTEWFNVTNQTPGADTTTISRMKPYLFVTSDVSGPSQSIPNGTGQPSGAANDRIYLEGVVRLSYIDN